MEVPPLLPALEIKLSSLLTVLDQAEFDEFLTGWDYRSLALTAPEVHVQLFVRAPWQAPFAALAVVPLDLN